MENVPFLPKTLGIKKYRQRKADGGEELSYKFMKARNEDMKDVKLFQSAQIRSIWNDEAGEWFFSVVDVVGALTDSADKSAYWRKLKQRMKAEGNETVTNCQRSLG